MSITKVKEFFFLLDYRDIYKDELNPELRELDSFKIGVTNVEEKEDGLHVYLRRPGYLIGNKGSTLEKVQEILEVKVFIHEVDLMQEKGD